VADTDEDGVTDGETDESIHATSEQQRPPRLSVRGPIKQRGGRDSARHRAKRVLPHEVFIVAS
jgi:hypothetical protein